MGNALVIITEYNLNDPKNAYVVTDGDMLKFEGGYIFDWGFKEQNNKCVFKTAIEPDYYAVINNDNLSIHNGWTGISISERKTLSSRKAFVVLVEESSGDFDPEKWYIPFSLIDWERGTEKYTSTRGYTQYKLYLIS